MTTYIAVCSIGDELYHYGIKDMRWGYRRWQNYDGSLTEAGRLRYNKGNGKRKFAKDVLNDTSRSFGKDGKEYIDTIKRWGKTAEELKIMDPNDPLSYFDLGGVREQNRILRDVYNSMPSVSEKQKKHYADLGQKLTKNADGYRKEKIQHLDDVINEFDADLHKELNTKPGKDTRNYIMDAVKGYNETDFDMAVYQHMDEILPVYGKGYIDTETFSKLYDGQVAEDAVDFLGYGWDAKEITKWHDRFQTIKNQYPSQESRLAEFFSQHPEIEIEVEDMKHDQHDKNELYHHGIKNQKWYKRRYQNEDGSLTPLGRIHYGVGAARKHIMGRNVNNAYKSASIMSDKLYEANTEFNKANQERIKAFEKYSKEKDKYDALESKLDRTQNGLSAKLIGVNGRKERKLIDKVNSQEKIVNELYNDYQEKQYQQLLADNEAYEIKNIATAKSEKADNLAAKYIEKYGDAEYRELYKRYPKLQYYENNH